jgi:hypothetical protein
MKYFFLVLFHFSAAYGGGDHVSPKKMDINKYPTVVAHVKSELKDEYRVKTIDSAGFYDLGVQCNSQKLYGLTYYEMKITDASGAKQDVSGLFTGSGGTQVTIFTMNDKGQISIIFDEVLIDWWGAVDRSNCPPIKVRVRALDKSGVMGERDTLLTFKNKKYQY